MMYISNQVIKHKVGLLNLAVELQNVMGVSRDAFYRYQELTESGDVDEFINKSCRVPNFKNRVDDHIDHAVIDYAIHILRMDNIERGNELRKQGVLYQEVGFDLYSFAMI